MHVSAEGENFVAVYTPTAILNNILIFRVHMNNSNNSETLHNLSCTNPRLYSAAGQIDEQTTGDEGFEIAAIPQQDLRA